VGRGDGETGGLGDGSKSQSKKLTINYQLSIIN
jgi:hypothetical protein